MRWVISLLSRALRFAADLYKSLKLHVCQGDALLKAGDVRQVASTKRVGGMRSLFASGYSFNINILPWPLTDSIFLIYSWFAYSLCVFCSSQDNALDCKDRIMQYF